MKSKKIICAAVAVARTMGVAFSTAGCIVTKNEEDVKQVVATVDITKNEKFVDFVKGVAATVAAQAPANLDALMDCKYNGTDLTVLQQQQEMVLVIGENIKVRRFARFPEGVSVPYIHAGGKIGVLVSLAVDGEATDKVLEMG